MKTRALGLAHGIVMNSLKEIAAEVFNSNNRKRWTWTAYETTYIKIGEPSWLLKNLFPARRGCNPVAEHSHSVALDEMIILGWLHDDSHSRSLPLTPSEPDLCIETDMLLVNLVATVQPLKELFWKCSIFCFYSVPLRGNLFALWQEVASLLPNDTSITHLMHRSHRATLTPTLKGFPQRSPVAVDPKRERESKTLMAHPSDPHYPVRHQDITQEKMEGKIGNSWRIGLTWLCSSAWLLLSFSPLYLWGILRLKRVLCRISPSRHLDLWRMGNGYFPEISLFSHSRLNGAITISSTWGSWL